MCVCVCEGVCTCSSLIFLWEIYWAQTVLCVFCMCVCVIRPRNRCLPLGPQSAPWRPCINRCPDIIYISFIPPLSASSRMCTHSQTFRFHPILKGSSTLFTLLGSQNEAVLWGFTAAVFSPILSVLILEHRCVLGMICMCWEFTHCTACFFFVECVRGVLCSMCLPVWCVCVCVLCVYVCVRVCSLWLVFVLPATRAPSWHSDSSSRSDRGALPSNNRGFVALLLLACYGLPSLSLFSLSLPFLLSPFSCLKS